MLDELTANWVAVAIVVLLIALVLVREVIHLSRMRNGHNKKE